MFHTNKRNSPTLLARSEGGYDLMNDVICVKLMNSDGKWKSPKN
jgi:hypothetical protein